MSEIVLTDGQHTIVLAGRTLTLKCTPAATVAICRALRGILPAQQRLLDVDVEAMAAILNAGINRTGDEADRTLAQVCEAENLVDLAADLVVYIGMLSRGGRRVRVDGEGNGGTPTTTETTTGTTPTETTIT